MIGSVIDVVRERWQCPDSPPVYYGQEIEDELEKITQTIQTQTRSLNDPLDQDPLRLCKVTSPRWVALKMLENDSEVLSILGDCPVRPERNNFV